MSKIKSKQRSKRVSKIEVEEKKKQSSKELEYEIFNYQNRFSEKRLLEQQAKKEEEETQRLKNIDMKYTLENESKRKGTYAIGGNIYIDNSTIITDELLTGFTGFKHNLNSELLVKIYLKSDLIERSKAPEVRRKPKDIISLINIFHHPLTDNEVLYIQGLDFSDHDMNRFLFEKIVWKPPIFSYSKIFISFYLYVLFGNVGVTVLIKNKDTKVYNLTAFACNRFSRLQYDINRKLIVSTNLTINVVDLETLFAYYVSGEDKRYFLHKDEFNPRDKIQIFEKTLNCRHDCFLNCAINKINSMFEVKEIIKEQMIGTVFPELIVDNVRETPDAIIKLKDDTILIVEVTVQLDLENAYMLKEKKYNNIRLALMALGKVARRMIIMLNPNSMVSTGDLVFNVDNDTHKMCIFYEQVSRMTRFFFKKVDKKEEIITEKIDFIQAIDLGEEVQFDCDNVDEAVLTRNYEMLPKPNMMIGNDEIKETKFIRCENMEFKIMEIIDEKIDMYTRDENKWKPKAYTLMPICTSFETNENERHWLKQMLTLDDYDSEREIFQDKNPCMKRYKFKRQRKKERTCLSPDTIDFVEDTLGCLSEIIYSKPHSINIIKSTAFDEQIQSLCMPLINEGCDAFRCTETYKQARAMRDLFMTLTYRYNKASKHFEAVHSKILNITAVIPPRNKVHDKKMKDRKYIRVMFYGLGLNDTGFKMQFLRQERLLSEGFHKQVHFFATEWYLYNMEQVNRAIKVVDMLESICVWHISYQDIEKNTIALIYLLLQQKSSDLCSFLDILRYILINIFAEYQNIEDLLREKLPERANNVLYLYLLDNYKTNIVEYYKSNFSTIKGKNILNINCYLPLTQRYTNSFQIWLMENYLTKLTLKSHKSSCHDFRDVYELFKRTEEDDTLFKDVRLDLVDEYVNKVKQYPLEPEDELVIDNLKSTASLGIFEDGISEGRKICDTVLDLFNRTQAEPSEFKLSNVKKSDDYMFTTGLKEQHGASRETCTTHFNTLAEIKVMEKSFMQINKRYKEEYISKRGKKFINLQKYTVDNNMLLGRYGHDIKFSLDASKFSTQDDTEVMRRIARIYYGNKFERIFNKIQRRILLPRSNDEVFKLVFGTNSFVQQKGWPQGLFNLTSSCKHMHALNLVRVIFDKIVRKAIDKRIPKYKNLKLSLDYILEFMVHSDDSLVNLLTDYPDMLIILLDVLETILSAFCIRINYKKSLISYHIQEYLSYFMIGGSTFVPEFKEILTIFGDDNPADYATLINAEISKISEVSSKGVSRHWFEYQIRKSQFRIGRYYRQLDSQVNHNPVFNNFLTPVELGGYYYSDPLSIRINQALANNLRLRHLNKDLSIVEDSFTQRSIMVKPMLKIPSNLVNIRKRLGLVHDDSLYENVELKTLGISPEAKLDNLRKFFFSKNAIYTYSRYSKNFVYYCMLLSEVNYMVNRKVYKLVDYREYIRRNVDLVTFNLDALFAESKHLKHVDTLKDNRWNPYEHDSQNERSIFTIKTGTINKKKLINAETSQIVLSSLGLEVELHSERYVNIALRTILKRKMSFMIESGIAGLGRTWEDLLAYNCIIRNKNKSKFFANINRQVLGMERRVKCDATLRCYNTLVACVKYSWDDTENLIYYKENIETLRQEWKFLGTDSSEYFAAVILQMWYDDDPEILENKKIPALVCRREIGDVLCISGRLFWVENNIILTDERKDIDFKIFDIISNFFHINRDKEPVGFDQYFYKRQNGSLTLSDTNNRCGCVKYFAKKPICETFVNIELESRDASKFTLQVSEGNFTLERSGVPIYNLHYQNIGKSFINEYFETCNGEMKYFGKTNHKYLIPKPKNFETKVRKVVKTIILENKFYNKESQHFYAEKVIPFKEFENKEIKVPLEEYEILAMEEEYFRNVNVKKEFGKLNWTSRSPVQKGILDFNVFNAFVYGEKYEDVQDGLIDYVFPPRLGVYNYFKCYAKAWKNMTLPERQKEFDRILKGKPTLGLLNDSVKINYEYNLRRKKPELIDFVPITINTRDEYAWALLKTEKFFFFKVENKYLNIRSKELGDDMINDNIDHNEMLRKFQSNAYKHNIEFYDLLQNCDDDNIEVNYMKYILKLLYCVNALGTDEHVIALLGHKFPCGTGRQTAIEYKSLYYRLGQLMDTFPENQELPENLRYRTLIISDADLMWEADREKLIFYIKKYRLTNYFWFRFVEERNKTNNKLGEFYYDRVVMNIFKEIDYPPVTNANISAFYENNNHAYLRKFHNVRQFDIIEEELDPMSYLKYKYYTKTCPDHIAELVERVIVGKKVNIKDYKDNIKDPSLVLYMKLIVNLLYVDKLQINKFITTYSQRKVHTVREISELDTIRMEDLEEEKKTLAPLEKKYDVMVYDEESLEGDESDDFMSGLSSKMKRKEDADEDVIESQDKLRTQYNVEPEKVKKKFNFGSDDDDDFSFGREVSENEDAH